MNRSNGTACITLPAPVQNPSIVSVLAVFFLYRWRRYAIVHFMNDVIVQDGDPVLQEVAEPVAESEFGTPELTALVERMLAALEHEKDGVALAAPQIGVAKRIFVVRYDRMENVEPGELLPAPAPGVFINPEIVRAARRREEMDEGCLSVRRVYGKTYRHVRATVRARQVDGAFFERGGGGILAQAFQHEIDHLDGILFIDHAHDMFEVRPEDWAGYKEERRERRRQENNGHGA